MEGGRASCTRTHVHTYTHTHMTDVESEVPLAPSHTLRVLLSGPEAQEAFVATVLGKSMTSRVCLPSVLAGAHLVRHLTRTGQWWWLRRLCLIACELSGGSDELFGLVPLMCLWKNLGVLQRLQTAGLLTSMDHDAWSAVIDAGAIDGIVKVVADRTDADDAFLENLCAFRGNGLTVAHFTSFPKGHDDDSDVDIAVAAKRGWSL